MGYVKERQRIDGTVLTAYRHDRDFFATLHRENHMVVRAYLMRRAHGLDPNDLDDIVQEVFVRAWRMRDRFRGGSSLRTFLIAIARNVLREHFAQRRRHASVSLPPSLPDEDQTSTECQVEQRDLVARIRRILFELSPLQRRAIEMICIEGKSPAEAAADEGTTVKAIRRRIENGRDRLVTLLSACEGTCDIRRGKGCMHADDPQVNCQLHHFFNAD